MRYLGYIKGPADLKRLKVEELSELAEEIRERIIEVVSKNGGHLASSLGATDLIIALHYVYNSPADKIIFDTGHQAYAHKILTGRNKKFDTLRTMGGISGFLKRNESEHDIFGAGHASTALSAACGIAAARDILKEKYKVVCVVADGAMTGGMSWEAMQNIGHLGQDMLVVLNDNQMFISNRVGQFGKILAKLLTLGTIKNAGEKLEVFLNRFQFWGKNILKVAKRAKVILFPGMIFEEMGFSYFGPIDGHNIKEMVEVLGYLKDLKGPVLLHVVTKKGKGYEHAEEKPINFHGTAQFDIESGEVIKISGNKEIPTFTKTFSDSLVEIAKKDPKVVAITAAMPEGTGLDAFRDKYPYRYYDVGIAEEHALTFAAGLATQGFKPVVAIYSSFMQRAFDQVMHDICLQKLPVVICMDRAGIVGEDGPTHHGVFDIGLFRMLPEMTIMAPSDEYELKNCLYTAIKLQKPVAIRYPRGKGFGVSMGEFKEFENTKAVKLKEGKDAYILATGNRTIPALKAAQKLENDGLQVGVYYFRFVKPLDEEAVREASKTKIITVEDNSLACGFSSAVLESLSDMNIKTEAKRLGIGDYFVEQGTPQELYQKTGIDEEGIYNQIKKYLKAR
ncbi:MAG TPA: 1-deoxy-D-xylulose-5-phosphate synthase [Elusimicrobiales bacterium]|mgnify:CR=1 FL=1|nr:1-deoxy-D-xylulose-5-phosphate synthase [Elusimicrobiales bacterium]HOL61835.1 1-deoxy-D-xylulose-5-phosphate synthase [Elusimicrobiales bacterium]HPO96105.1 1-deoxy-D-xylulose-5-phosphate synthase [Elusimicrobiales bacterium]